MKYSVGERLATRGLLALLLAGCLAIPAWAAGPTVPNAGSILQRTQPATPTAAPSGRTRLKIEQPGGGTLPVSIPFLVKRIDITGNTRIATAVLHALVSGSEGKRLTLPELGDLARRITDYYHTHGYPLARAVIPAQTIHAGTVRFEIIEARYSKVTLNNRSRVSSDLLRATLDTLRTGSVVTTAPLDRSLLLLSDIPGLAVNAVLTPGEQVGTSDLQVDASLPSMFSGAVTADNSGDRYTGRARLGGTLDVLEPFRHGDIFSLSGLTAGGGMNYGSLSYAALLDGAGTRLGGAFSALHYRLSGQLSALGAHGNAQVASAWASQPLIRERRVNLYGQLRYDHLQLNDQIGASGIEDRRHLDDLIAGVSGNVRDNLLRGGVNSWSASWTYGHVDFNNAAARLSDAATADTQGRFSKWNLSLARLQGLTADDAVYLAAAGQWTSGNLDSSQQMVAGGPGSVRGYDADALAGDVGYQLTAELRHTFPRLWYGQWQAIAFVDHEHLSINKTTFAPGPNAATLNGAGIGVNWAGQDQWAVSATLAAPIGARPELVGSTASVRGWLQVSKGF